MKTEIRHIIDSDREFWFTLDKHLNKDEFGKKVRDKQGYVLTADGNPAGILRYNLFWDNTPFCTLLYIDERYRKQGYGKLLAEHWEKEMSALGYGWLLVSTVTSETAQHFYHKLGYNDCGHLNAPEQDVELFLCKYLPPTKNT